MKTESWLKHHAVKKMLALLFVLLAGLGGAEAQNIFVNIRTSGSTPSTAIIAAPAGYSYSAAAPVSGTTWNIVSRTTTMPQNTTPGTFSTNYTGLALKDSSGASITPTLTVSYYSAVTTGTRTEPSTATSENVIQPGGVMAEAWRNYLNASGNYFAFTVSNLPASTPYGIYFYGGTGTSGQGVGVALAAGNFLAGAATNGFTTNTTVNSAGTLGSIWTVGGGKTNLMPQTTTWNVLYGQSDAAGGLRFLFNGLSSYAYLNGFQIVPLAAPGASGVTNQTVIAGNNAALIAVVSGLPAPALQWFSNNVAIVAETNATLTLSNVQFAQNGAAYSLVASNLLGAVTNSMTLTVIVTPGINGLNNQAASVGSAVTIPATVSGVPTPALRWRFNGNNLSDGASISGSATDTLTINSAQAADSGVYSLVASNSAGAVTNSMTLTVSAGNVAPGITGPANQTVIQSNNSTFTTSVSGLPVPGLQWRVNGVDIPGATSTTLTLTNVLFAQNGFVYSLVASNSAGLATNSAALTVLVPPVISQPPTNLSVVVGSPATFSVGASGVPAVKYQWLTNGNPLANATNAAYTIASAQGANNGLVFSVVVSNSAGVVTSSSALLTVLSTMTGSFLPTNGAANLAPDQQLRIVFSGTPTLGAGKLYVRDAADNSVFATIDTSQFASFTLFGATVTNAAIRTVQGATYFYTPIAIYSNTAWITLNPTNRFAYNKTYYVNADAGLFLDSANAAFPAITGTNAWRFSTKAVGPATPTASTGPTNLTVALDGAGDFATLQGASDWIPQNNTLKRTITVQPGTYRDNATFAQSRNNVMVMGAGATRQDVQIFYPYPAFANATGAGTLRLESSDIYIRNLTIDDAVYLNFNGVTFAGPIQTLITTGNRLIFDNVLIKGGQDTLYTISGITYFNRCEIWGSVDYIYGAALTVFDQCDIVEIRNTGGPITAPNTDPAAPYGLTFLNCNFPRALTANGYPYDVGTGNTTFQRPWRQDGNTAIINCALGSQISTKGWGEWDGRETTCRAREVGTTLIGGGTTTPAQRQAAGAYWLNTIDPDYVSNSSLDPTNALLFGAGGTNNRVAVTINTNDYTLAAIFGNTYYNLNGWLPATIPTITTHPTNRTNNVGTATTFTAAAIGTPAPTFQWLKNGTNIFGATNASFSLAAVKLADNGVYSVVASNSAAAVTSSNATLTVPVPPTALTPQINGATLNFFWPTNSIGFRLEMQTHPPGVGLNSNWFTVPGSADTNQKFFTLDTSLGSAFFRLVYP
jgi:pectin methylesterase-like acyl-CoA thioesterase